MSTAIYRLLLRLYPAAFRRRWEEEMVYTFELQLADDWLGAWWCALTEFPLIPPPELAIPAVSLAGSGALLFALTWAMGNSHTLNLLYKHIAKKLGG